MKFSILLEMVFDLLAKRKVTAVYFAEKFGISVRTVYRYVDDLTLAGVPIQITRGREGGICISDSYKLPKGFMTKDEYEATIEALQTMYAQLPEERFLDAKRKISAQVKSEIRDFSLSGELSSILVDGGTWGDTGTFAERLRLFENCIKERQVVEMEYYSREGDYTKRKIEPHVLVFKQNVWYVYAFCRVQRAFRLFRVGRVRSTVQTDEIFNKRPFTREDIPLHFFMMETDFIDAKFGIDESVFADAQDWLGCENLRQVDGKWYAEVSLPDDEGLIRKILGMGAGIEVLSPPSLRERVANTASQIAKTYHA
ncbi:MAG: YafY family transcriptional regulator [Clostridiales bacterium]|nr:YafY family transcriptional regulator [Clostridiales bacterium]